VAYSQSTLAVPKLIAPVVRQLSIEYCGFRNVRDRREYVLLARLGSASCEYTVWIANSAFAAGHALLQDGPDLCYQKLRRELADVELTDGHCFEVTASELQDYRTAHLPPQRRGFTPKPSPALEKSRLIDGR
jgi:hypothetical protein